MYITYHPITGDALFSSALCGKVQNGAEHGRYTSVLDVPIRGRSPLPTRHSGRLVENSLAALMFTK